VLASKRLFELIVCVIVDFGVWSQLRVVLVL